jgi:aldose 1-epimerase
MKLIRVASAVAVGLSTFFLQVHAGAQTKVVKTSFGKMPDGAAVDLFTLTDKQLEVRLTSFGAHITDVLAPDRSGKRVDVVLGYKDLAGYLADTKTYMGSVVGRYGNRIAKGQFTLDGKHYQLSTNEHGNTLHGGVVGFDRKNWTAKQIPDGVEMTLVSPDGDMGFPGQLTAHVRYTLTGDRLRLEYSATTTKPTVLNLTNHSYFNLGGSGDILSHVLQLNASRYTPVNSTLIPTGTIEPVAGTPLDFTSPHAVGERIKADNEQLKLAGGYDHNWVFAAGHSLSQPAAVLTDPASGRTLTVYTTQPGVQFYSGNFLDGTFKGRDGQTYNKYSGMCLETQHFPDSPNQPNFPTTELKPGQMYHSTTIFQFGVAK